MSDEAVEHEEARRDPPAPGRGGWIYLGLLTVVAIALAVVAIGVDDDHDPRSLPGVVEPVDLVLRVDGSDVTLEGRVPAADVRDRLVELAGARYGPEHVDEVLTLDRRTTLDGGEVAVAGSAPPGDPDPEALQADIASAFLLRSGPVELEPLADEVDEGGPSVAMVPSTDG